jgi:hypothetical protein
MGEWAYPDEMARLYEKASKETDFGGKHFLSQTLQAYFFLKEGGNALRTQTFLYKHGQPEEKI